MVVHDLDAGADIEHTNEYGFDDLRFALWGAHLDSARLLVERDAAVGVDEAAPSATSPFSMPPGRPTHPWPRPSAPT